MTDTRVIRAIIYLRLSDLRLTDLKEGETIEEYLKRREEKLREFAKQLSNDRVLWEVVKVVRENDAIAKESKGGRMRMASATKRRTITLPDGSKVKRVWRPGFLSILKDFENGTADGLLAETLDRVAREPRDMEDLIDVAKAHKVNARVLSGNLTFTDGGTSAEQFMARGMVNHAKMSADDTAWRVAEGRERKALAGEWAGGIRPFGWDVVGNGEGDLVKRDAEFKVIRGCTIRALQGITIAELAEELRQGDVPTVTGVPWSAEILTDVLKKPMNAGYVVRQGKILDGVKGKWEAPVEPERWKAFMRLFDDPDRKASAAGCAARWQGSGVYGCGICDDGTSVEVTMGKREPRYRCRSHKHFWSRNVAHVDRMVSDWVVDRLSQPDAITMFAKPKPTVDVALLQTERTEIKAELKVMGRERLQRKITADQMRDATEWGTKRINEIDQMLRDALDVDSPVAELLQSVNVRATWESYPLATKQAILRRLVVVKIMPTTKRGSGFDPASVVIRQVDWDTETEGAEGQVAVAA